MTEVLYNAATETHLFECLTNVGYGHVLLKFQVHHRTTGKVDPKIRALRKQQNQNRQVYNGREDNRNLTVAGKWNPYPGFDELHTSSNADPRELARSRAIIIIDAGQVDRGDDRGENPDT